MLSPNGWKLKERKEKQGEQRKNKGNALEWQSNLSWKKNFRIACQSWSSRIWGKELVQKNKTKKTKVLWAFKYVDWVTEENLSLFQNNQQAFFGEKEIATI